MRVLNAVQRIIMLLLLIPVVIICLNALLRALNAQPDNPIVSAVREARDRFVLPIFRTVFEGRNPLQDEIVTLAAIGVLAIAVIFLFRMLRSLVGTRPPKSRPAPAAKKKTSAKAAPATPAKSSKPATSDQPAKTETAAAPEQSSGSSEEKSEAPVASGSSSGGSSSASDDDTHSSSS